MKDYEVQNISQALAYMVECTLATVETMATTKKKSKREYQRQIDIAQKGINWMCLFGCLTETSSRTFDARNDGSVAMWAAKLEKQ